MRTGIQNARFAVSDHHGNRGASQHQRRRAQVRQRGALRADFSDPLHPRFAGRYRAACGAREWPIAHPEPARMAARAVAGMWQSLGGQLDGQVREGRVPPQARLRLSFESPPLAEVVRETNKYSNNVMAQQIFLTLGQAGREGTPTGLPEARLALEGWWQDKLGPGARLPEVGNGSGLGRDVRLSASALARLLQQAWNSGLMPDLAASLPASSNDIAGRQGMPDLGTLVEFGPRLKTVLARPSPHSQVRVELPVRSVIEVQGGLRSQGLAVEPELTWATRVPGTAWGLSTSASLIFGDDRLNRYFYGVPADLATADRPAYEAKAGLIASRLTLMASRSLGPDVRVFGFMRAESYAGSANAGSPLYLRSTGTSAGLGLNWTLGRSEARAR